MELPEIAVRRMSRVVAGGVHPDADLLTAFVEGTLARNHRLQVVDHLTACSECNRLVALIAPEHPALSPVLQPVAARSGWLAWARLRWVGAAAAAAIVVSTVWIGHIEPGRAPSAAVEAPAPPTAAQLPAAPPAPARPQPSQPKQAAPTTREVAKSPARPQQPAASPANTAPAIAAQSPSAVPGEARGPSAFQAPMISGIGDVRGENAFRTSMASRSDSRKDLPSPPEPSQLTNEAEPATATRPNIPTVPAASAPTTWSVSDAGVLQKSNDSGHTWAAVPVPGQSPLHAVAVSGQDVWVGGDRGTLYHSTDAGQTWTAVVPLANGQTLSADIVRIGFFNPRHGWIATREGVIWTTRDHGATWSLQ